MERSLSAIFAVDIVGYSRLMEADETSTMEQQKAHRRELIDPAFNRFHGRIVKEMGDGILVEFPSVVEAVRCAIAIQGAMPDWEAKVSEDRRISYRIGINLGDIIIEGNDMFGDGVNVATRLEQIAEPRSICISGTAYDQIEGRSEFACEFLGEKKLKNISRPIRAYRVSVRGHEGETVGRPVLALPDKPSIAVLPFDNMSDDREKEFLADGLSEDLITGLSQVRWLFVIARNSSFSYKGQSADVRQVGRELGVRYVIEGSIRTSGNRVRVSAQLVDAIDGKQLWAERFDRELTDIFLLQDEITETILAAIQPELSTAEQERARRKPPNNLDAWEAYQRGLWHLYHFTNEHFDEAMRLFTRAIDLDPNFSPSLAGKAYVYVQRSFYSDPAKRRETLAKGLDAARLAVNQDEKDASAHFSLGRALCLSCDFDAGIDELRTALSLNPSFAQAHFGLGHVLAHTGQMEMAIESLDRAIRLSPHDPHLFAFYAVESLAHFYLGRYEEAVVWASKSVRAPHATFWPYLTYTAALAGLGQLDSARAACAKLMRRKPGYTTAAAQDDFFFTRDRKIVRQTVDALRTAGLPD